MIGITPNRLRACLAAAALAPAEADRQASLPDGTTEALLRGEGGPPHTDVLLRLVLVLDCTPSELVGHGTKQDRDFDTHKNRLTHGQLTAVLCTLYRTLDEAARQEMRQAVEVAASHREPVVPLSNYGLLGGKRSLTGR